MGVESLQTISNVLFIAAGVVLVVSIILFFTLEIPKAFGLVTGLAASRGVKKLQKQNIESSGHSRSSGTSPVSTRPMRPESPQTSKIKTTNLNPEKKIEPPPVAENTTILNIAPEPVLPIKNPDAVFMVLQELSFASSSEIIE
jgi:hypothetical protein